MNKNMLLCYIDSSGFGTATVAVAGENVTIIQRRKLPNRSSSPAALVAKLLIPARKARLGNVCAVVGEGSFNGIRAGVSLALGIAMALDIPAYAIDAKHVPKDQKKFEKFLCELAADPKRSKAVRLTKADAVTYGSPPNIS